jgi:phospholipase/carboxylesterase
MLAPEGEPTASVIWLHGLGQDSHALMPVARQLGLPQQKVRSVFPRAPGQSAGMIKGRPARAWFDQKISALDRADLETLLATEAWLQAIVAAECASVGAGRVLIAGFSQGAAMALITGLRYPERLGGLVLYAPFMITKARLFEKRSPSNADMPVWIGHGRRDSVVPMFMAERVRNMLLRRGHTVSWHKYPAAHEAFGGAMADLRVFLDDVLLGSSARDEAVRRSG